MISLFKKHKKTSVMKDKRENADKAAAKNGQHFQAKT